jgi:CRP-like cAMP-binding protein
MAKTKDIFSTDSYLDHPYESQLMKSLVDVDLSKQKSNQPQHPSSQAQQSLTYRSKDVLPDWLLSNDDWKILKGRKLANEVSDILKIPIDDRTQEQCMVLVEWMMSVWPTSAQMGYKRVASMLKEFTYATYQPGESIVREGDRGLSFFIIISGTVDVIKNEVGIVGHLTRGATFGEIALMNQSNNHESSVRTATISVTGNQAVEVLSLHKVDYDHFVRDIQLLEKRENFLIFKESKLLQYWPRSKLEKLSNTALRRVYQNVNDVVFRQGDPSNHIFFIVEGSVKIMKEVSVTATNKWPIGSSKWHEERKKASMPIVLNTLEKGDYFGEVAVLRNCRRTASAIINSPKTVLMLVDRLEFLHTFMLVSRHQSVSNIEDEVKKYKADTDVLRDIAKIKGGPSSYVSVGNATYYPNQELPPGDYIPGSPTLQMSMKSKELENEIDNAHESLQSYSSDLKRTLRTLFPTLIHDDDSMTSKSKHSKHQFSSTRRSKRRNVHNHVSAKLAYHEEKTKDAINEILTEVMRHEAIHNHNTYLLYQQLSPRTIQDYEDDDEQ